ncbi:DUF1566 domain-containing protein [Pseudomonas fontis]|uniref:DUF1566 domain-containing protein n=1 Tax=Pseudomonas fontis TaxID=2942633 RepID=A0ABT5P0B3_9PSED|nr:DUF1566 domain-containing protein [Pseudomonas fontis]MDD0977108.1 DUF1566 domain-containing protein [Pseudomonas fontis]MDD0993801.1 DUF1566 domain-containing protein [Pseudomonas fontis]
MSSQQQPSPPAIGEIWPGQGGIYAGIMPARNGQEAYHLILGEDLGRFEWGQYDDESPATNLIDGWANTTALVERGGHPAAEAAALHIADGHADFCLPAAAQLYEIWLNLNGKLEDWVWSSSQRSADTAFIMGFADGTQDDSAKYNELRVRPVRRLPIQ